MSFDVVRSFQPGIASFGFLLVVLLSAATLEPTIFREEAVRSVFFLTALRRNDLLLTNRILFFSGLVPDLPDRDDAIFVDDFVLL